MENARYSIGVAAQRAGLSPHVIRAWERRYGALTPSRSCGRHRLYSDDDISRLRALRDATRSGHAIGQVAALATRDLHDLAARDAADTVARISAGGAEPAPLLRQAMEAVYRLDSVALGAALARLELTVGLSRLLEEAAGQFMARIGDAWERGDLCVAHEHLASASLRSLLGDTLAQLSAPESAPLMVATTPAGHMHEIGALLAAISAASVGWRAVYLGPNLPADEIAGAALSSGAEAVALSLVYPPGDTGTCRELCQLRRLLGPGRAVIVGGGAADTYSDVLVESGMEPLADLGALASRLRSWPGCDLLSR